MRILLSVLLLLVLFNNQAQTDYEIFIERANYFLNLNVYDGEVDYNNIAENPQALDSIVELIAKIDYQKLAEKEKKVSFLINAYNLLTIYQVSNKTPLVQSPLEIPGFFEVNKFQVGSDKITLNHLENEILRMEFFDPRYHFVLVCAGRGCPPIISKAYTAKNLDNMLNIQTKLALNDSSFIRVKSSENEVEISEIFKWYTSDFTQDGTILQFINEYRENKIPDTYKISHYPYDWSLNIQSKYVINDDNFDLQIFTPGSLLKKGQIDVFLFNSVYTHTKSNWMGQDFTGFRETFASSLLQITYGITKDARFNIGLDFKFVASGYSDSDALLEIGQAFRLENSPSSRVGVALIGPRIKWQPFIKLSKFSIQSSLLFPTTRYPEGKIDQNGQRELYFLEWARLQWWNQFFYVQNYRRSQLFFEVDIWARIGWPSTQASAIDFPTTIIYSYFPNNKVTLYGLASHMQRAQVNPKDLSDDITSPANYTSAGLGVKYQLNSRFNIELLYTNFLRGTNSGIGNTLNLGFRYIR